MSATSEATADVSEATAQAANDKALTSFKAAYTARYGGVGIVIPWAQLLAMLMSMLTGCVPTPANIKAQIQRPFIQLRMSIRLLRSGMSPSQADRAVAAAVATFAHATDDDVSSWVVAAQEIE